MFIYPKKYDVIVVGGGHAGVEAALAAARMGCDTLLLTINVDAIGQMSCNPAIGGLAKGHLAREIDALGGEMGKNTDMTGIQFRTLNKSSGPAVWAPRAQCDKKSYQFRLKYVCESQNRLDVKQDQTSKVLQKDNVAYGVETNLGVQYFGKTIIITAGTFLRGLMHIGFNQQPGGRAGDAASINLSSSLKELGIELGRLKTGTPPRLIGNTINYTKTEIQDGDYPVPFFSFWNEDLFHVEHLWPKPRGSQPNNSISEQSIISKIGRQLPCYLTYTTKKTAELVKCNLHKSPLYSGVIEGVGPRYCPSIEDKVIKFSDKDRHQIFLEPEGVQTNEIYVNGFSTSLPFDLQIDMIRSIIGCEDAEILRPAYAVEYDFANPIQLNPSLESKKCTNLFLAGQINGTSGYEEAAAQGLMAGINAARKVQLKSPIILGRNQAYIGVLIDDLVTKGTVEPYRMFTSRAEYRLLLRHDNADLRLSRIGHEIGLLPARCFEKFLEKETVINNEIARLHSSYFKNDSLAKILSRPKLSYNDLSSKNLSLSSEAIQQVETTIKYAGYIRRQEVEIAKNANLDNKIIPKDINYKIVPSLRLEARQKLAKFLPHTIGQAGRISGVSPSDISVLLIWLKNNS